MAKERSKAVDYAVYLGVRAVVCVLQMLSYEAAARLAGLLAWLAYRVDRRHRLVADDNLKKALPALQDDRERDRVVRAVYRHFCTLLMGIVHLPRKVRPSSWKGYVDNPQGRELVGLMLSGRPLLLVTGHFGNW